MTALVNQQTVSRAVPVQQIVSPRGVTAWLVEDYAVPLVSIEFAFKGGAAQDPAGKAGALLVQFGEGGIGAGGSGGRRRHG